MYDVLYLDKQRSAGVVASHLERQSAIEVARAEARRRHAARMFAAGSATTPGNVVLIVESTTRAV